MFIGSAVAEDVCRIFNIPLVGFVFAGLCFDVDGSNGTEVQFDDVFDSIAVTRILDFVEKCIAGVSLVVEGEFFTLTECSFDKLFLQDGQNQLINRVAAELCGQTIVVHA